MQRKFPPGMKTNWSFNKRIEKKRDGRDGSNSEPAGRDVRSGDRVEQCNEGPDCHDLQSDERFAGGTQYLSRDLSDSRIRLKLYGQISLRKSLVYSAVRSRFCQWLHTNQIAAATITTPMTASNLWKYLPSARQFSPSFMPR